MDLGREVFLLHYYRQNEGYTLDHKLKALFSDLFCWSHLADRGDEASGVLKAFFRFFTDL